ncbi:MAG: hypothetical protein M3258_04955, partial [Thermoproteota archaeon]|nr:hypothetical protein [Thermoproteota archaeon]
GTAFISFATSSGYGKETIKAADGKTVTATVYEIVESNPTTPNVGKGIVTAVFQTNSTGTLTSLNGMILVGTDDMSTGGASHVTLWRWESGIVSSSNTSASSTTITSNNSTSIAVPPDITSGAEALPPVDSSNNITTTTAANELSPSRPPPSTSLTAPY